MTLEAIRYRPGSLQILNQLLLPHETVYEDIRSVQDGYDAIKSMKVRTAMVSVSVSALARCICSLLCAASQCNSIGKHGRDFGLSVRVCVCMVGGSMSFSSISIQLDNLTLSYIGMETDRE